MSEVTTTTSSGTIRGVVEDGINRFLGVPYAAPPVGDRRFETPQPAEAWSGTRDAIERGPNAPQIHREFKGLDVTPLVRPGWQRGKDFLAANIWTPDVGTSDRPVMVFIHGGAFVVGDKDASILDGAAFARSGVVLITINYRMGIEGFLPIPGAPTNLGLRDQLAALRWVQSNATAFGGDPRNVTVFGESAGAMSVADLVASPLAEGLFQHAIVQSGHGAMVRPVQVARRLVDKLARILDVEPTVDGFRSRSIEDCLDALEQVQNPLSRLDLRDDEGREPAFGLSRFLPVVGDDVLPKRPVDSLADGVGADVDVLIGTNREEMNLYLVPTGLGRFLGTLLGALVLRRSEPKARAILKAYRRQLPGATGAEVFAETATDLVFRLQARRFAEAHRGRTFFYELGWRSPACDGRLGACHGVELPFVFDTLATCTGPDGLVGTDPPQELADRVHDLWCVFATDGRLPWPEFDATRRQVFALETGRASSEPELLASRFVP